MKPTRRLPNVPWITADGAFDPAKLPIDSTLRQCVNSDLERFSAETFTHAVNVFGIRNVTDLAGLMAFYEFLYLSSNATFDVQMPPGQKPLLPLP